MNSVSAETSQERYHKNERQPENFYTCDVNGLHSSFRSLMSLSDSALSSSEAIGLNRLLR